MLPIHLDAFGAHVSIWDLSLGAGILAGYAVLRLAFFAAAPGNALPRFLSLRYLVTAYVAVIAAQLFSYTFDAGTTLFAPASVSAARYYLSPFAGPKTLYGAVLAVPFAALLVSTPLRDLSFERALACWTPAMFTVLAFARLGCFLQGCCYGMRSESFGVAFAPGSVVQGHQLHGGLVEAGAWSLPVVPTQLLEALVLACLAAWTFRGVRAADAVTEGKPVSPRRAARPGSAVFFDSLAAYSALRFLLEIARDDAARNHFGPLSTSQWIALLVLAAYVAIRHHARSGRAPPGPRLLI